MIQLRPKIPTLGTGQLYLVNKHRVHMLNAAERRHAIAAAIVIVVLVAVAVYFAFL